jgi:hypothetical protein
MKSPTTKSTRELPPMSSSSPYSLALDVSAGKPRLALWQGLPDGPPIAEIESDRHPLQGIFSAVDSMVQTTGIKIEAISDFIINAGPGGALPLRQASLAVSVWQSTTIHPSRLWTFNGAGLIARWWARQSPSKPNGLAWALRPGEWLILSEGTFPAWDEVVPTAALKPLQVNFHLAGAHAFPRPPRDWPADLPLLNPKLSEILLPFDATPFIHQVSTIELIEPPVREYVRWSPVRHQGTPG